MASLLLLQCVLYVTKQILELFSKFVTTISNAANALVACDGQEPFISLRIEETHAVHDPFGLVTAGAFDYPKIISQNG